VIAGPALLFCPADRPDRYRKAADAADAVILDLEDGVAPERRPVARQALIENPLDPERTIVRLSPAGTPDHDEDRRALTQTAYTTVMLAKAESPVQIAQLAPLAVIALCETARGVLAMEAIAAQRGLAALFWGAEDLIASTGGSSSRRPDGAFRDVARHARSTALLAAAAHGVPAIDSVYLTIGDLEGLRAESIDAAASGFAYKACIHPTQVAAVRAAFRPTEEQLDRARRLTDAARTQSGAFGFEGQMVDGPVLAQARATLAAAGELPAS
jgi:citrate lyase subunit beta/citryl-CoA lyase